jgi:predicted HAD superfamily phosphohydrolase
VTAIAQKASAFQQEHVSQLTNMQQQHLHQTEEAIDSITKRYEDEREFILRKAEQIILDIADNFSAFDSTVN